MRLLEDRKQRIGELAQAFKSCHSDKERLALLLQEEEVKSAFQLLPELQQLSEMRALIVASLIAIGVWHALGGLERVDSLYEMLLPVEEFYKAWGGIVGYQALLLSLLAQHAQEGPPPPCTYHPPQGIDIASETEEVRRFIIEGIRSLPSMAEMYVVGGAADRLQLYDPIRAQPLPAAKLSFCGHTLLKGLLRDLQAREWLYFKLFREQLTTPVALMTSPEKNNHDHIMALCEEENWFGRGKAHFFLFEQPLVPTMDVEGQWCVQKDMTLLMKPGGHGVLWKMAQDCGVFSWFKRQGRSRLLIRQINNPLAGVDYGLLAFCGVGCVQRKQFGFASCSRQVGAAEGMNVLIEKREGELFSYCLTNIEYCDFKKFSISDVPRIPGGRYSQFPSNTNILFADIAAVETHLTHCPVPGMLVNIKEVVRLESTMQNLADCFVCHSPIPLSVEQIPLETFLTHHQRHKTISTTKKMWHPQASLLETPEGALYDWLLNAYEVLTEHCRMEVPPLCTPAEYLERGPPFLFFYHGALGPLFSLIGQKVRGGTLAWGSELLLEIADVDVDTLILDGALHIIATEPLGAPDAAGVIQYSDRVGSCTLHRVTILNRGIDRELSGQYWKKEVVYKERCEIRIHGDGEFFAHDVVLPGDLRIEVEAGVRLVASMHEGQLCFKRELLDTKRWLYSLSEGGAIVCTKGIIPNIINNLHCDGSKASGFNDRKGGCISNTSLLCDR